MAPAPMKPSSKLGRLLIVDDEAELLDVLCSRLAQRGFEVAGFPCAREALQALENENFDLLLTDLMMPEMDGLSLLRAALQLDPHLVGVVMTGHATVQTAIEALKTGALDYVLKPFKMNLVLPVLSRALEVRRLRQENIHLRETVAIYDLSKVVSSTTDLNVLVSRIADAALQQCEGDEVSLMAPSEDGKQLCVQAVRGDNRDSLLGETISIDCGIAGWVARHQESLILNGQVQDARFQPIRPRAEIRTAISMPMVAGGNVVGVLNINGIRRRHPFTLGQVKALSILASTSATALEAAQLLTKLRKTAEALRRSETMFKALFEYSPEAIVTVDRQGHITAVNTQVEKVFGYARGELTGQSVEVLIPEQLREQHILYRTQYFTKPWPGTIDTTRELRGRRKDGSEFPADVTLAPVQFGGESYALASIHETTNRKEPRNINLPNWH